MESKKKSNPPRQSNTRLVTTAVVGSALEWYDFGLYGATAALVFAPLFFPSFSPLAGTLAAFATYAVGFLSRPLGGIIFSHYGDKIGRRPVLAATLIIMGLATCLMGLLPTFEQAGIWAPIMLVALRLVQGLGAGAEYGGAALMLAEHNPTRRGYYGAFAASGVFVGVVLSLGVFYLITASLSQQELLSWGWRVPYLLSIFVIGVGIYLRLSVKETPEFEQDVHERKQESAVPLMEVLKSHPRRILLGMGVNLALVGYSYVVQTYVLTYITSTLGMSRNVGLIGVVLAAAGGAITMPMFGALADRIGARQVIIVGATASALFAFPFFWMLETRDPVTIWIAIFLGLAIGVGSIFGPIASFYSELFETRLRYTGLVFAREVSGSVVGGFTPFLATLLVAWSGGQSWPVSVYMIVTVVIPLICAYLAKDMLVPSQPATPATRAKVSNSNATM